MVRGILDGTSLGKISGHRKGDIAEKFDMNVCISCHYQDSAHGAKRVYKDFCTRCHDVRSKGNLVMGPTHLNSARWANLHYVGNGILFLLFLVTGILLVFRSRKKIVSQIAAWTENMKIPVAPEEPAPQVSETAENQENHEDE
jgi:hypothetical protein